MSLPFQDAAQPQAPATQTAGQYKTIVCEWASAILADRNAINWELLRNLVDAQNAGHTVIYTGAELDSLRVSLEVVLEGAEQYGVSLEGAAPHTARINSLDIMYPDGVDIAIAVDQPSYVAHDLYFLVPSSGRMTENGSHMLRQKLGLPAVEVVLPAAALSFK